MLRRVGGGSYGEVWLARNVIGAYRAVKIVYRSTFLDARPFEREFNGIHKYEPISRSHPGLVQVLQVGRNSDAGYFYYVMELADDQCGVQNFHPDSYSARTLSRDVSARGRLEFQETIELGIALADALGHLHLHGLIHRDIKPSNIIFVNGRPKLADIGLVVTVGESDTMVGTEGFIPPEGPTSPQSDIYSFGKVLYEISTGNDRNLFPELPEIKDGADAEQFSELNEIINKACAPVPADRYQTTEALCSDLEVLRAGKSVRRLRALERRLSLLTRVLIAGGAIILVAIGGIYAVNSAREREQKLRALAYIEGGARMIEDRNYHAALPYFAQALDARRSDPAAADLQRLRIGMLLNQSVQLLQVWTNAEPVNNVTFSADGKRLLLSQKSSAQLWDIASRAPVSPLFQVSNSIETARLSPDQSRILIAASTNVHLIDAASGRELRSWHLPKRATTAVFSADGKRIACGCTDSHTYIFDAESESEEPILSLKGHTDDVDVAWFSPSG
ncbi:MAG TPA: WD40 repeat domain-containing serine/threonine protein kinase, partial [Candidatus Acidoferrum sp.]|nr:WD40 repeat domain-containing serine/threonine protein kinase [Candidatus Acidoferrum sp.]